MPKPGPKRKFTASQVRDALNLSRGNQKAAANLLGCNRSTLSYYWEYYPSLKKLKDQYKSERIEDAKSVLDFCLTKVDVPYQVRLNAAIFILSTQDPEYIEKRKNIIETGDGVSAALKEMVEACRHILSKK